MCLKCSLLFLRQDETEKKKERRRNCFQSCIAHLVWRQPYSKGFWQTQAPVLATSEPMSNKPAQQRKEMRWPAPAFCSQITQQAGRQVKRHSSTWLPFLLCSPDYTNDNCVTGLAKDSPSVKNRSPLKVLSRVSCFGSAIAFTLLYSQHGLTYLWDSSNTAQPL